MRETLFEKTFNMKKNDKYFSNKYINIECFNENGITYVFLAGRWTGKDDKRMEIPAGFRFVECKIENNEADIIFLKNDVPLHIFYALTNRNKNGISFKY